MKIFLLIFFIDFFCTLQANPFSDTTQKVIDYEGKTVGYYAQMRLFVNRWTKGKKVELMYMRKATHYTKFMFGKGKAYIDPNTVADNINPPAENNTTSPVESNGTSDKVEATKTEDSISFADLYALYDEESGKTKKEELTVNGKPRARTDIKVNETSGNNEHLGKIGKSTIAIYTSVPEREGECELIERALFKICLKEQENVFCVKNLTPVSCGGNLRGER